MESALELRGLLPEVELLENEPMSRHTTFRIGGPARWMFCPKTPQEAGDVLRLCREKGVRPFFLGNGSNLLVSDEGYGGVVLSTAKLEQTMRLEDDTGIYVQSGVLLSKLANFAADHCLTGLEFASGIPGSVGGAVRMNAGAYGGEISRVLERVDYLDLAGRLCWATAAECDFSYRRSVFCKQPWLITGALFRLRHGQETEIRGDMAELARRRREKQPVEYPSAGSTFKRPQEYFAAALIEECGLKGFQVGGAQVSEKHSGFVINRGGATCADVLELMAQVRSKVLDRTGVMLEPEVEILR